MLNVKIEGMEEMQKRLGASEGVIRRAYRGAMQTVTVYLAGDARKGTPVDTGRLRASITPRVESSGDGIRGIVGTNVKYAPYIEYGTKAHWPPLAALSTWARRHGTTAYRVALGIARNGTKAHKMFEKAFTENRERVVRDFNTAVEKIVKELSG